MDFGKLLQQFAGARDTCVGQRDIVNLALVCHEAWGVRRGGDEQLLVSCGDSRRRGERLVHLGSPCILGSVEPDATLLLEIWACRGAGGGGQRGGGSISERRACGELRIPVPRLVSRSTGMLYQTWLTLDSPGLWDSVASIGLSEADGHSTDFEQKLVDGPRQFLQPRVCLSLCKASEASPNGEVQLSPDEDEAFRSANWGALLRSHEQHLVLNAALHLQGQQTQLGNMGGLSASARQTPAAKAAELRHKVQEHAGIVQALKERLAQAGEVLRERQTQKEEARSAQLRSQKGDRRGQIAQLQEELAAARQANSLAVAAAANATSGAGARAPGVSNASGQATVEQMRAVNAKRRQELADLKTALEQGRKEAGDKVKEAEARVLRVKKERDNAVAEGDRLAAESERLRAQKQKDEAETKELLEQRATLMRIIEELHSACLGPGVRSSSSPTQGSESTPSAAGGLPGPMLLPSPGPGSLSASSIGDTSVRGGGGSGGHAAPMPMGSRAAGSGYPPSITGPS